MTKTCETRGIATEKDHLPGCYHQQECVSCGRFLLKHVTRFPLGANKMKICFFCFRSKWESITRTLGIDWPSTEDN